MGSGIRLAGIAIAFAAALIGPGCGDDDGSSTPASAATTTPAGPTTSEQDGTISTEEFARRADQVCAQHEEQMVAAFTALQNPGSDLPTFAAALDQAGTAVSGLSADLDAVPLPGDSDDATAYVENLQQSAAAIERGRAAAAADDQAGVEAAVKEFGGLADETARLGSRLGFERCGKASA